MILFIAYGVIVASMVILGGDVSSIGRVRLRFLPAVVAAFVIQIAILQLPPDVLPVWLADALHVSSFAIGFVALYKNRHIPGLWLAGLGGMMNFVAIVANGGRMPAHPAALARAGLELPTDQFLNSGPVSDARLWFLGDVFPLPGPDWLHTVFSVGDVLLFAGIFIVVHSVSNSRLAPHLPGYRPPEAERSHLADVMAMMDAAPIGPVQVPSISSEPPTSIEQLSGPPRS